MMLAALAAALLQGAAVADQLGPIPPDGFPAQGTFTGPGTQEWRADLERGKLYALEEDGDILGAVSVVAAGGGTIASFGGDAEGAVGTSFRAPYSGAYTVRVTVPDQHALDKGDDYTLRLERDCPGDASTPCQIAVGQTHDMQRSTYDFDHDWYWSTGLRGGSAYVVTLASDNGDQVAVRNGAGRIIAGPVECGPGRVPIALAFTAPANGRAYLDVGTSETTPTAYSVSLAAAH
jgi:hypothetical protein